MFYVDLGGILATVFYCIFLVWGNLGIIFSFCFDKIVDFGSFTMHCFIALLLAKYTF